jgi:hypothetical protein
MARHIRQNLWSHPRGKRLSFPVDVHHRPLHFIAVVVGIAIPIRQLLLLWRLLVVACHFRSLLSRRRCRECGFLLQPSLHLLLLFFSMFLLLGKEKIGAQIQKLEKHFSLQQQQQQQQRQGEKCPMSYLIVVHLQTTATSACARNREEERRSKILILCSMKLEKTTSSLATISISTTTRAALRPPKNRSLTGASMRAATGIARATTTMVTMMMTTMMLLASTGV